MAHLKLQASDQFRLDMMTESDRRVLDLVGITAQVKHDRIMLLSEGAVDLVNSPILTIDCPSELFAILDSDYGHASAPIWARELLNELLIHISGYGDDVYEGIAVPNRQLALAVLRTIASRNDGANNDVGLIASFALINTSKVWPIHVAISVSGKVDVFDAFRTGIASASDLAARELRPKITASVT